MVTVVGLFFFAILAAFAAALAVARTRTLRQAEALNQALQETHRRYLSHLDNTPMGMIEWDQEGRVCAWNLAAERIFGFSAREAMGRLGDAFLSADPQRPLEPRHPFQAFLPGDGGSRLTRENLRKDGTPIICNWTNAPLRDREGRTIGISSMVEDITERKRNAEALRVSQKLESLGVLAGGIAHDFNNLLTAIQGHTELALHGLGPEDPHFDNLKRIEATTHRAADLARQMLSYSGRAHFAAAPVDLNQMVRDMAELLKVSIPKKIQLNLRLESGLPPTIGDPAQLQQVALNLVTNAAEAIGTAQGQIDIQTRRVDLDPTTLEGLVLKEDVHPGPFLCMEVHDTGAGMPGGVISKIFDPFFTTKFSGRGLGLSATAGILRSHGGGLAVESEEGKGTLFRVYFPATDLAVPGPAETPPPSLPGAGTVLVVDDEGIVRDLAVMALKPLGYDLLTAQDGEEAVALYRANPGRINVVVMDMTMPRMDGLEAFQRIRALDPRARVILSSGYSEKEAVHAARELNPEGFLQKPYRIQELIQQVQAAVTRAEE
jgi:PAS domain S-box-containing protein